MVQTTIALGSAPIFGQTNSREPKILALHGWGRTSSDFQFIVASEKPAIALDMPGFGLSPLPSSSWGTPEYADAIIEAIDQRGYRELTIVGHSRGGCVAVRIAAKRPDLVSALVLSGSPLVAANPGSRRKAPAPYRIVRALHRRHLVPARALESLRRRYGSADYLAASPELRPVLVRMINEDYTHDLEVIRRIQIPVALIWGRLDSAVPISVAEQLSGMLDVDDFVVGPEVSHDTPGAMRAEFLRVIAEVQSGASPRS